MKPHGITAMLTVAMAGCTGGSTSTGAAGSSSASSSTTMEMTMHAFRPVHEMGYGLHFGADRRVSLPIPVRRPAGLWLAVFLIGDVMARAGATANDAERLANQITVPRSIQYLDPASGAILENTLQLNEDRAGHFGIPDPPGLVVGRFDDPAALPKERIEALRQRIFAALDILLPFFADESRPWTEHATTAAQEVRDFFPLAAEPGLWPYYKAEGREFFAWVETHAPASKAPLPWEGPAK